VEVVWFSSIVPVYNSLDKHNNAPLKNSTTRAVNLYRQSGLSINDFLNRFHLARTKTKERTKKKDTAQRPTSKMAYFFAVLADSCGLRAHPPVMEQGTRLPHR
jgi:hypothetical protein